MLGLDNDRVVVSPRVSMRFFAAASFLLFHAVTALGAVTWSVDPFNPAAVPLAVKSPYLSAWLPQGAGTALSDAWPTFWTGSVGFPHLGR